MEQVIFLIVIYTIWGIAQAISKNKKKTSKPAPQRKRRQPPVPQEWKQKRGEAPPSKDPELPEFLRGLLEMAEQLEEKPPVPQPPATPAPMPEPVRIPEIVEEDSSFEYADDGREAIRHVSYEDLDDAYDAPEPVLPPAAELRKQLLNPQTIRQVIVLKEILDKPVSLRRRGIPFGGV